tara:strand:+ start:803 stop:1360 length:558 start_codon:yes stop_codon:yes gene_type:complete
MGEFTKDWFTQNIPIWTKAVLPNLSSNTPKWLELGTYEGRAAEWILDNAMPRGGELTCVDIWKDHNGRYDPDAEKRFDKNIGDRAIKRKGLIFDFLLGEVRSGRKYDAIYVDGGHDATEVMEQSTLCWRIMSPRALIIWDDYSWRDRSGRHGHTPPGVAIDGFIQSYLTEIRVIHKDYQVIAQKL